MVLRKGNKELELFKVQKKGGISRGITKENVTKKNTNRTQIHWDSVGGKGYLNMAAQLHGLWSSTVALFVLHQRDCVPVGC